MSYENNSFPAIKKSKVKVGATQKGVKSRRRCAAVGTHGEPHLERCPQTSFQNAYSGSGKGSEEDGRGDQRYGAAPVRRMDEQN